MFPWGSYNKHVFKKGRLVFTNLGRGVGLGFLQKKRKAEFLFMQS